MLDATGAFVRQFTPVEGGYLYYPSARAGGKLVTAEEFEALSADWRRISGTAGQFKLASAMAGLFLLWAIFSVGRELPEWANPLAVAAMVAAISARMLWAARAPRRLVKARPDVAPPRTIAQEGRGTRVLPGRPFVAFALLFGAALCFGTVRTSEEFTLASWAQTVAGAVLVILFFWIAFRKMADRRR